MAKAQRTKAPRSAINKDQDAALRELAEGLAELCQAFDEGEGGARRMRAESAKLHAYTALEYLQTAAVARAIEREQAGGADASPSARVLAGEGDSYGGTA